MLLQVEWIASELGKSVPLHLTRYFPVYKRENPATSDATLKRLYEIAVSKLDYVYIGNTITERGQDTYCQNCGECVTTRSGYSITLFNLDKEGRCTKCGNLIYRDFTFS
jgi:pyruvate formate lyase activating enzyme